MGTALTATAVGTGNILSNRIAVDMSEQISLLKPRAYPFTTISKRLSTKPCNSYKFEWMEESLMARWSAINNAGTAYDATTTGLVVDDETIFAVGDILKAVATGECMKVTAVTAATHTLTVVRAYGETAAHANSVANDVKLLCIGNANMQGGIAPAEKCTQPTPVYNYTQIFKTPFSVTNTLEATKLIGGSELARIQSRQGVYHGMSIEYSLLFGERKLDTSGAQPVTTTGGILKFLSGTTNVSSTAASGTVAQKKAALDAWIETLFTKGTESRTWFCSPGIISLVNAIADDKLQLIQADKDKTYGLDVIKYMTPHGVLNMVYHPLLTEGYANYSFALDLENTAYRPLTGRDTKLKTNIQANDEDGRRDMYITEAGLELRLPTTHGIFYLT